MTPSSKCYSAKRLTKPDTYQHWSIPPVRHTQHKLISFSSDKVSTSGQTQNSTSNMWDISLELIFQDMVYVQAQGLRLCWTINCCSGFWRQWERGRADFQLKNDRRGNSKLKRHIFLMLHQMVSMSSGSFRSFWGDSAVNTLKKKQNINVIIAPMWKVLRKVW